MKRILTICGAILLNAGIAFAQDKPVEAPHDMQHMHHGGFMQGGMHHAAAKGVVLDAKVDAAAHTVTLRVGPMNLPANTSHMKMPQPPDLVWEVPMEGWLLAYHPRLVDAGGNAVPGTVLHHVAFWNENRADFLCPNKEEHIFGAGSEMTDWTEVPGYGYRVQKGDKIRIETMMYNPTATSYDKAYLDVVIPFQETVATLDAKSDAQGLLEYVPVKLFVQDGGYKFARGDVLKISATYDNPTGKLLRDGAMGIAVGYFVAADETKMAALRRKAEPTHDMAGMSHDQ